MWIHSDGDLRSSSLKIEIFKGNPIQTDMATPALATYGSDYLKKEFLTPSVSGDRISCIAVSESSGGSDVAGWFRKFTSLKYVF